VAYVVNTGNSSVVSVDLESGNVTTVYTTSEPTWGVAASGDSVYITQGRDIEELERSSLGSLIGMRTLASVDIPLGIALVPQSGFLVFTNAIRGVHFQNTFLLRSSVGSKHDQVKAINLETPLSSSQAIAVDKESSFIYANDYCVGSDLDASVSAPASIVRINITSGQRSIVSEVLGCPTAMVLGMNSSTLYVVMHSVMRVIAIVLPPPNSRATSRAFSLALLTPPSSGQWSPQGIALSPTGTGLFVSLARLSEGGAACAGYEDAGQTNSNGSGVLLFVTIPTPPQPQPIGDAGLLASLIAVGLAVVSVALFYTVCTVYGKRKRKRMAVSYSEDAHTRPRSFSAAVAIASSPAKKGYTSLRESFPASSGEASKKRTRPSEVSFRTDELHSAAGSIQSGGDRGAEGHE